MRIASDCYDGFRAQSMQQPCQQRSTSFAFLARMAAVRHRIICFVRMERKHIPKKDGKLKSFQHGPDYRRGSLGDGRPSGSAHERGRTEKVSVSVKMHLVGERKTRATSAPVTEVACNPDGFTPDFAAAVSTVVRLRRRMVDAFARSCQAQRSAYGLKTPSNLSAATLLTKSLMDQWSSVISMRAM